MDKPWPCGFCQTKDCQLCPEVIRKGAAGKDWHCPCAEKNHGRRKVVRQ